MVARARRAALACVVAGWIALPGLAAEKPHVHYMLQCQGCHRADGRGSPGAVPSLADSLGLFLTVEGGREFLVRVPGSAQSPLDDAELAAVLNWMIRRFGPARVAADFEPYGAAEVGRLRRAPLTDVQSVRRELAARIERLEPGALSPALPPDRAGSPSRTPAP